MEGGKCLSSWCPALSSLQCLGKCYHFGATLFALEYFNNKNLKIFVDPLTCASHLSKWNVSRDSSTNFASIGETLAKIIKFVDNPFPELLRKNNYYDPCAPDDKHLDNDSLRTLKIDLQKCLLSSRFFLFDDFIHLFLNLFHSMVFKDTHREKAPWNKIPVLTKCRNMGI